MLGMTNGATRIILPASHHGIIAIFPMRLYPTYQYQSFRWRSRCRRMRSAAAERAAGLVASGLTQRPQFFRGRKFLRSIAQVLATSIQEAASYNQRRVE